MDRRQRRNRDLLAGVLTFGFASLALPGGAFAATFTDVTASAGMNFVDTTFGTGWGDFDSDGNPDLFVCRHYLRPILYRNLGNGQMNSTFFPPLFDAQDHHGPLICDFDGDGDPDIYLTGGADAGSSSIPKRLYRNDGNFQFTDVAMAWGLADSLARGRASSATDVDSDGDIDIFVAKAPREASPNSLFISDGSLSFTDVAALAGLADEFGSEGGVWGDYDRDGDPDLLIGGEEQTSNETRLYRNEGGVTFRDVTAAVLPGLGQIAAADWGDFDADGDLDLAVGHGDSGLFDAVTWTSDSLSFFFNTRGGDNGVDAISFTQSADSASFDIYRNGFYDPSTIFISSDSFHPGATSPFSLFDGDILGAPSFVPGADIGYYLWSSPGANPVWDVRVSAPPSSGATFGGIITTNGTFTDVSAVDLEPYSHGERGARLWRNDGNVFVNVSVFAGLVDTSNVRNVTWVDLDQDGLLDLHVLVKGDSRDWNMPNLFYRNLGGGAFGERSSGWALEGPENGLGDATSFEDWDGDGDLDLAITSGAGPRFFARLEKHRLYRNDGPVGNWLEVDLEGVQSTRDGLGAWVTCSSPILGRQTRYVAANSWRGSCSPVAPRFGLGADAVVDSLVIQWPSGRVNLFQDIPANQSFVAVEGPSATGVPSVPTGASSPLLLTVGPNPSPGETVVRLLGRDQIPAHVEIFDPAGRRVLDRTLPPGTDRFRWDGKTPTGGPAAAGVYFARVREGARTASAKIVRISP